MVSAYCSKIFKWIEWLTELLQEVGQSFVIVRELEHCLLGLPRVVFRRCGPSQLLRPISILRSSFPFAHVSGSGPFKGNEPDDVPCHDDLRKVRGMMAEAA
jgi:hypothetical protein